MVKLDVRLIHKISPNVVQPPIPSIPRSLKFKLSPRKLKINKLADKRDLLTTVTSSNSSSKPSNSGNEINEKGSTTSKIEISESEITNGSNEDKVNNYWIYKININ